MMTVLRHSVVIFNALTNFCYSLSLSLYPALSLTLFLLFSTEADYDTDANLI